MIVEPDDHGDSKFLEDRDIIGRSEDAVLNFFKNYAVLIDRFIIRRAEGNEFVGDDPVEIAVFYFFIVLILVEVEFFIIEPLEFEGVVDAAQTVKKLG